jgi:hypothetical protein
MSRQLLLLSLRGVRRTLDLLYGDLQAEGYENVGFALSEAIDVIDRAIGLLEVAA